MSGIVALVVDDDARSFALVLRICDAAHFTALQAVDVERARVLVAHKPAIVFTARTLSGGDGLSWITELRRVLPEALIVVISESRDLTVMDAGADLVITRPLDEQLVASMIQAAAAQAPVANVPAKRLALLVIEPDPHLAVVMKRWLKAVYDVTLVTTAWRALEELRRTPFDAILAELRLPDMSAMELHAELVRDGNGLGDRTLFMTAGFIGDKAQQFLAGLPGQWLYKPFDLARLRAALAALVEP